MRKAEIQLLLKTAPELKQLSNYQWQAMSTSGTHAAPPTLTSLMLAVSDACCAHWPCLRAHDASPTLDVPDACRA